MPLAGVSEDPESLVRFCRRICSGASILLPDIGRFSGHAPKAGARPCMVVSELSYILRTAVKAHDISLVPIVIVGDRAGADLAAAFLLQHGLLLAGAVLLRPSARIKITAVDFLDRLPILLGLSSTQEAPGTAGWQLRHVLSRAGAQLICERVPYRPAADGHETALARVFITSLFGG